MPNIIKKAVKKSILFKIGAAAAALFAMVIVLRLYLSWVAPERLLKDSLSVFFKDNFGKAVKFEDVRLTLAGNVRIVNLDVSISSDFNDNISLIRSPSVTIDLNLPALLSKKISITGIRFDHPQITLLKRYNLGYGETLRDLFMSGKPLAEVSDVDMDDFSVLLSNGRIMYVEYLVGGRISVECRKVSIGLNFRKDAVNYYLNGILVPFGSREISRGSVTARGTVYRAGNGRGYSSVHRFSVENLDISHINAKLMSPPYAVFGGLSAGATVHVMDGHASIDATAELNNLNLVEQRQEGARSVVANENLNIALAADVLNAGKRIIVRKIDIGDDSSRINASGIYCSSNQEEYFDVLLERCRIDLARLSEWLIPWENVSYQGSIEGTGRFSYDIRHKRSTNVSLVMRLDDFSITRKADGRKTTLLSAPAAHLTIADGAFLVSVDARKGRSDLGLKGEGYIAGWMPLVSESGFAFNSRRMEALYPIKTAGGALKKLYTDAFEDKARGYEQIFFMKTPLGVFVNNNTIECDFNVEKLLFGGRAALSNLKSRFRLADGYLRLEEFALSGLGGEYGLEMRAYLKSDYPGGSVWGRITGINLEEIGRSLGVEGSMSGTLGADFKFEFSGTRKAHLLDNGKFEFNLGMDSGRLSDTVFQKRLKKFVVANGLDEPSIGDIGFTRVTLSANQSAENVYFSNVVFSGDSLSASGYGAFRPQDGLRLPINFTYMGIGTEDAPGKMTNAPLVITGRLFAPVLRVMNKKDSAELALYNID
ncbi:MAG TPA: hypothetical protein VLM75_15955 [Spirochaetota bacterium]|nr:hypothetical protein [Spirochaetota bacterium]